VLELAVLADDLTGGMIIAAKLEAAGVVCPLVTEAAAVGLAAGATAMVLARKIRLIPPVAAKAEAVAAEAAFRRAGARTIYYKYSALFDSTDEGNIGPIADALLDATGAAQTIFCPAYVDRGVTMYKGHLFVLATLMSESFKRFDPMTPAKTSNVVAKLGTQTARAVGLIDHQMLQDSIPDIHAVLARQPQTPYWIADAIDEADLAKLAELTRDWPLVTGADSLAPAILRDRRRDHPPEANSGRRLLGSTPGYEAVIAGSCSEATRAQLESFSRGHPVWRIDLARDATSSDLLARIAAWAAEQAPKRPFAVATSADPDGVAAAQAAFGRQGASELADRVLGAVAAMLRDLGVRKFVVAGGETSGEVLAAVGAERLDVAGYDNELFGGYCQSRGDTPLSFVVKPGSMGGPDFFLAAFERMRAAENQA
jgi:3-dehydrotetronate 4-kinase